MNIGDYLLQIICLPLFTILLIITPELDVKIILSIAIVLLSLITRFTAGYSLGLERRNDKNDGQR